MWRNVDFEHVCTTLCVMYPVTPVVPSNSSSTSTTVYAEISSQFIVIKHKLIRKILKVQSGIVEKFMVVHCHNKKYGGI